MEVRYYSNTDTAYIYFLEPGKQAKVDESEEVAPGVIVDYTKDGVAVGIEIYDNARQKLSGSPMWESEDERALEIGRAWIAGHRAGQTDREVQREKHEAESA